MGTAVARGQVSAFTTTLGHSTLVLHLLHSTIVTPPDDHQNQVQTCDFCGEYVFVPRISSTESLTWGPSYIFSAPLDASQQVCMFFNHLVELLKFSSVTKHI